MYVKWNKYSLHLHTCTVNWTCDIDKATNAVLRCERRLAILEPSESAKRCESLLNALLYKTSLVITICCLDPRSSLFSYCSSHYSEITLNQSFEEMTAATYSTGIKMQLKFLSQMV